MRDLAADSTYPLLDRASFMLPKSSSRALRGLIHLVLAEDSDIRFDVVHGEATAALQVELRVDHVTVVRLRPVVQCKVTVVLIAMHAASAHKCTKHSLLMLYGVSYLACSVEQKALQCFPRKRYK